MPYAPNLFIKFEFVWSGITFPHLYDIIGPVSLTSLSVQTLPIIYFLYVLFNKMMMTKACYPECNTFDLLLWFLFIVCAFVCFVQLGFLLFLNGIFHFTGTLKEEKSPSPLHTQKTKKKKTVEKIVYDFLSTWFFGVACQFVAFVMRRVIWLLAIIVARRLASDYETCLVCRVPLSVFLFFSAICKLF